MPSGIVSLIIRWLMLSFAVWVAAEIVPGIHLEGLSSTLIVAAILGLLNLYLRPILFMLSLPVTIVTFGLFVIVVNALLLGLTDWLVNIFGSVRFDVEGLGSALLGALIISIVSMLLGSFIKPERIAWRVTGRGF